MRNSKLILIATFLAGVTGESSGWFDWTQVADASVPVMAATDISLPSGCENVICDCQPNPDSYQVRKILMQTIKCQDPVIDNVIPRVQQYMKGDSGSSAMMFGMTGTGKSLLAETLARALFSHKDVATTGAHQAACCARKNMYGAEFDVRSSCFFAIEAAGANDKATMVDATGQMLLFKALHPRGILLLDEINTWPWAKVNDLLVPLLKHPSRHLVLSGANLPEMNQLKNALAPLVNATLV